MQPLVIQGNDDIKPIAFTRKSKIAIIGVSGSGKSTLAKKLEKKYKIKHIELDSLYMNSNWVETEIGEFREKVASKLSEVDGYIIDGNYKKVKDLTWDRCDTIIWLNYGKMLVMKRVILRTVQRIVRKQELWNGNKETFKKSFLSKDSIILWSWNTYDRRKKSILN